MVQQTLETQRERIAREVESDEISQLHSQVLERLQEDMANLERLHEGGRASADQVRTKRNEIDRMRIEMAHYRREQTQRLGGDTLAELNREPMRITIDHKVQRALLEELAERNKAKAKLLNPALDVQNRHGDAQRERLMRRRDALSLELEALEQKYQEMQLRYGSGKKTEPAEE